MAGEADAFILLVLAFIFPPAAVAMLAGCGVDLCINFLLTLLGWFPGCVHAFWLILKRSEANETYGYKNWTYSGMGKYDARGPNAPINGKAPQPPLPPPPPQKSDQTPVDQKSPAPAPAASTSVDSSAVQKLGPSVSTDQNKSSKDQLPPPPPPPPQVPMDQKQTEVTTPQGV